MQSSRKAEMSTARSPVAVFGIARTQNWCEDGVNQREGGVGACTGAVFDCHGSGLDEPNIPAPSNVRHHGADCGQFPVGRLACGVDELLRDFIASNDVSFVVVGTSARPLQILVAEIRSI